MKPCPFCGKEVDLTDPDTLYPDGWGWKSNEGYSKTYHNFREVPKEQWCYTMHCPEVSGGCGAEIGGDTKEEAMNKWDRRVN